GQQGGEDTDGRGLAGAVRPEQAEDLARADVDVDPVDGCLGAEAVPEAVTLDRARRLGRAGTRLCFAHRLAPSIASITSARRASAGSDASIAARSEASRRPSAASSSSALR